MTNTKLLYTSPCLTRYGTAAEITQASFSNSQQDSIFFAGAQVGTAVGSLDACVAQPANVPGTNCEFP